MPPPPVPRAVKEEARAAAARPPSPIAVPPLVPASVRAEVLATSAASPMDPPYLPPPSPGVSRAEDPRRMMRDKQRKRRLGFGGCCSSPRTPPKDDPRVAAARRPGMAHRTFSPGLQAPPESPRSKVRGAMASRAKKTVVLAYHPTSIDALFALLAAWLRHRGDAAVALVYLPLDPSDSLQTRMSQAEAVVPEDATVLLLGCAEGAEYVLQLTERCGCNVVVLDHSPAVHESLQDSGDALPPTVEIITEHMQQSTACLAWDHFDRECAESIGDGGGSGGGEALARVAAFGGDVGRLRTIFSYVEDRELTRDELDDSEGAFIYINEDSSI